MSDAWNERYTRISPDGLLEMIGKPVHLAWATSPGFVWILDRIEGGTIHLHTPKTGKLLVAKAKDAIYTRRYCPKHQEID